MEPDIVCRGLSAKLTERGCKINQARALSVFNILNDAVLCNDYLSDYTDNGDVDVMLACMSCGRNEVRLNEKSIDELLNTLQSVLEKEV